MLMPWWSFNSKEKAQELLGKAQEATSKGMYTDAFQLLRQSVEKDSDCASSYNLMAWILAIHNQDLANALEYAKKAITLTPESDTANLACFYDTLAEVFARQGEFDAAIKAFEQSMGLAGDTVIGDKDYDTCYRLAICYMIKQDFNGAFFLLQRSLQLEPKNPNIYFQMGDTCTILERYTDAVRYYSQAIELAPEWNFNYPIEGSSSNDETCKGFLSVCCCNLGHVYYLLEDYENSQLANEASYSYNVYQNPVCILNLASLAAKKKDKKRMRYFLEEGIPLLDTQQNVDLIAFLLCHPNLQEYRDIVLDLLRSHGKITQSQYIQYRRDWSESRICEPHKGETLISMNEGIINLRPSTNIKGGTMSIFDQRYQRISGGKHDNIAGNQYNYNSEGSINFDSLTSQAELIDELEKLKAEIVKARDNQAIDEEVAEDAEYHLKKAIRQSQKPEPSSKTVSDHLKYAKNAIEDFAATTATGVQAVKALKDIADALSKAIALVGSLF